MKVLGDGDGEITPTRVMSGYSDGGGEGADETGASLPTPVYDTLGGSFASSVRLSEKDV